MRILQIVHGFPPESIAGTERYCEALSRCLLQRGHECMVLSGSWRCAPEATLATVDRDDLLVTRYLRAEGRPRRWTDEYDPEAELLTRQLLTLFRPDVVHLHHWLHLTNNLVAICADLAIPVVVTLHDDWTSCPRIHRIRRDGAFCADPPATAPCLTCAERGSWEGDQEITGALALRREMMDTELAVAAALIVPSEAHRAFLLRSLDLQKDRFTVLPNGRIQTVAVREVRREGAIFPKRPLQIGHWGYLMYHKGTHLILEAVHRLRDPSAVQLHLIGTPMGQGYEQRLRELAQGIPVRFHGAYQPAHLESFDLDIAVFASIFSESYSFTLDEAFSLGLPVLASDRGAFPERIGPAGLTFRAGDAGDLARRLQEILDAPERLDTMRRSIHTELLFSMEAHVAMLEKVYEDATNDSTSERTSSTPYLKLMAHAKQQVREREAALADQQERLAQAERALHEKEALLQQARNSLQEAERALHDKETHLQQTRRNLEQLQEDHAKLQAYLEQLRQTTLFKLQELLTKLSKRP